MPISPLEHFRAALFRETGLAMAVLDTSGRIVDWNGAAERVLGFSRREALGQSALLVRRPEDARRLELLLRRTAREGGRIADFETHVTRADGSEIPVSMSVCPLTDADGEVAAVGVALLDLSRQKALERRLAEHERMVAMGRLAGGMSHYINNILAAVSARVELALATRNAAATDEALRLTAESVDRLANITRNLLLFAGAEHRRATTCRPDHVARQLVEHLRGELGRRGIELADRVAETPEVHLDARDFHQVLENLILNSAEAIGAAEGSVTIRLATTDGGDVVLTVADTGGGIPADDQPHVFEPFWTTRGSLAGGPSRGALGLGLTVARSLARAAGGSVRLVDSGSGGTTLAVRLPAAGAQCRSAAEDAAAP
jgi:PAS domain S-box-containing protein